MIGEKIKIGFDGSEVKKGLSGIMGGFGKLKTGIGRVTRQVGIGAARQMGMSLFGSLMRVTTAIPREIKALSDLRQEFFALNDATGASVDNMLALRQAIAKTSNVSPDMASKALKEIVGKIGEAQTAGTEAYKSTYDLNLNPRKLKGQNVVDQLELIAEAYQKLRNSAGEKGGLEFANDTLGGIMGARMAKDLTPLLLNFKTSMASAKEDTKHIAENMRKSSNELDSIDNIQIAFSNKMSELALGTIEVLNASGITAESIANKINGIKVSKNLTGVADWIKEQFAQIKEEGIFGWIWEKLKEIGAYISEWLSKAISDGIKSGLSSFLPSMPKWLSFENKGKVTGSDAINWGRGILNNVLKAVSPEAKSNIKITPPIIDTKLKNDLFYDPNPMEFNEIENNTSRTNDILEQMSDKMMIARYA
jgi:hypothetical protein